MASKLKAACSVVEVLVCLQMNARGYASLMPQVYSKVQLCKPASTILQMTLA